jgi:small subunit ribosomal protein S18
MEHTKQEKSRAAVIEHFDYKNVPKLKANINPHARMNSRKRTGLSGHEQRAFAQAIKRARFMALIPYVSE